MKLQPIIAALSIVLALSCKKSPVREKQPVYEIAGTYKFTTMGWSHRSGDTSAPAEITGTAMNSDIYADVIVKDSGNIKVMLRGDVQLEHNVFELPRTGKREDPSDRWFYYIFREEAINDPVLYTTTQISFNLSKVEGVPSIMFISSIRKKITGSTLWEEGITGKADKQ